MIGFILNIGIKNFGNCSKPEAAELAMRGTVVGWALGYHGHTFVPEQSKLGDVFND